MNDDGPGGGTGTVALGCRVVASDQWLVAHFDAGWKIADVKRYVLRKVAGADSGPALYHPPHARPVSPITFASVRPLPHDATDDDDDDDAVGPGSGADQGPYGPYAYDVADIDDYSVYSADDPRPTRGGPGGTTTLTFDPPPDPSPAAAKAAASVAHALRYALVLFSTGQLLEDDFTLAWYCLRAGELVELHPPHTIVRLPRAALCEYVQPYLECRVRALRVLSGDDRPSTNVAVSTRREPRSPGPSNFGTSSTSSVGGGGSGSGTGSRRRKKTRLEWKERWLVLHGSRLCLYKHRADAGQPAHGVWSLDALARIARADEVLGAGAAAGPHVVCARFRAPAVDPPRSPVPTAAVDGWTDPWTGSTLDTDACSPRAPVQQAQAQAARKGSASEIDALAGREAGFGYDAGDGDDSIWLIVDTLNAVTQANLLRVLHRHSPHTLTSSIVSPDSHPPLSPSLSPTPSHSHSHSYSPSHAHTHHAHAHAHSPSLTPLHSYTPTPSPTPPPLLPAPLPYPDWRTAVTRRAQRAGLGTLTRAHATLLYGADPSVYTDADTTASSTPRADSAAEADAFDSSARFERAPPVELEWDGWARDVARQSRRAAAAASTSLSHFPTHPARPFSPVSRPFSPRAVSDPSSSPPPVPPKPLTYGSPSLYGLGQAQADAAASAATLMRSYEDALSADAPALLVPRAAHASVTTTTVSVGRARSERRAGRDDDSVGASGSGSGGGSGGVRLGRRKTSAAGKERDKDGGEKEKESTAARIFNALRPERVLKALDPGLEFVEGRR